MKGSGVSTGMSVGVSAGRASGGFAGVARSTGKASIGVSLSPEARSGFMSTSSLSAKDRGMMINRAAISPSPRSIFDILRPVNISQPNIFSPKLDINNGRSVNSKVARVNALNPQREVFKSVKDIKGFKGNQARTTSPDRLMNPTRSINSSPAEPRSKTVSGVLRENAVSTLRTSEAQSGFKNLDSRQVRTVKPENVARPSIKVEASKTRMEAKTITKPTIKSMIAERIKVDSVSSFARSIELDVLHAEKMALNMRQVYPQMTELQTQKTLCKTIVEKYKGKTGIFIIPELKLETEEEEEAKKKTESQKQPIVDVAVKKATQPKIATKELPPVEIPKLYFAKDGEVNKRRVKHVFEIIDALAKVKHEKGELVTGWDVAKELHIQRDEMSELARPQKVDYRLTKFKSAIAGVYGFIDMDYFRGIVDIFADYYSAIKLTHSDKEIMASGRDAMDVYKAPLDKVDAYVGELRTSGKLTAKGDHMKVVKFKDPRRGFVFHGQELVT